ncbi:MAG: CDP-alcohol phosphatidyltransferase family protein [Halofilum sp. (in: g-proteobacteria)]
MRHLPNILSGLRLAATVPLLALAWFGEATAFLILLLLAILSDGADGWIARRFNAYSALGVRLDSAADYAIYIVIPLGGWWLWPELVTREAFWFGLVVIGYALPGAVALLRFRRLSAYHTWSAKLAVALLSVAVLTLFAGGPAWPLHIGAPIALLAGLEQTLITLIADRPRDDLPSVVHALRAFSRRV